MIENDGSRARLTFRVHAHIGTHIRFVVTRLEDCRHEHVPRARGLHSPTFPLNLSALYGIGDVRKGLCSPC